MKKNHKNHISLKTFTAETILGNLPWGRSVFAFGYKEKLKLIIGINLILVSIISLFYTDSLVNRFEERERKQVSLYAQVLRNALSGTNSQDLTMLLSMIEDAHHYYEIPAIYVDENGDPGVYRNISIPNDTPLEEQQELLKDQIIEMAAAHPPIPVELGEQGKGYIYYSDSSLLLQLRYYPYIQLLGIFILIFLAYLAFSSTRKAEQNKVWVGLAKETAHQLGTPLSSLMAWIEYFRSDPAFDQSIADEMEKDVQRLEMITTRFSNIGSAPILKEESISEVVNTFITYLQRRVSTKVKFYTYDYLPDHKQAVINRNLFEWVIENICKNAVDAMGGIGEIHITLQYLAKPKEIMIDIRDTGKGISAANQASVFNPGFSTKKRGWGLGLTLAKRIIENYHNGKLFIKQSEIGKGTTFRIIIEENPFEKK